MLISHTPFTLSNAHNKDIDMAAGVRASASGGRVSASGGRVSAPGGGPTVAGGGVATEAGGATIRDGFVYYEAGRQPVNCRPVVPVSSTEEVPRSVKKSSSARKVKADPIWKDYMDSRAPAPSQEKQDELLQRQIDTERVKLEISMIQARTAEAAERRLQNEYEDQKSARSMGLGRLNEWAQDARDRYGAYGARHGDGGDHHLHPSRSKILFKEAKSYSSTEEYDETESSALDSMVRSLAT